MGKRETAFWDLLEIVERLRRECPWDREQTHRSLKKYLIEEAYEVLDAIDSGDDEKLLEELGDLLLQPLLHAQIAKERGAFDIYDVIGVLAKKLVRRHPHVFGNAEPEEVLENWERNKMKERESVLDGVPKSLPALMRSQKLQDRASRVGFDFTHISQVWDKVREEIEELEESIEKGDRENIKHEIGDVLTAVVELARFLGVDAEEALQEANERFIKRFRLMERLAKERGKKLEDMNLSEMDALWEEAKRKL